MRRDLLIKDSAGRSKKDKIMRYSKIKQKNIIWHLTSKYLVSIRVSIGLYNRESQRHCQDTTSIIHSQ